MFQWLSVLRSERGREVFLFKLEKIWTAFLSLSPLAKREVVVRWEMGNQQHYVKFLINQGYMEIYIYLYIYIYIYIYSSVLCFSYLFVL